MTKLQKAYNLGLEKASNWEDEEENPYELYSPEWEEFLRGYEDAARLRYDNMR